MSDFSAPFDELEHPRPSVQAPRRPLLPSWARVVLLSLSATFLWVAILTAALLLLLRGFRFFLGPLNDFPWTLKSAIPLIAIGFSYLCFIATTLRKPLERLLGFLVALAFILWGAEQFLPDQSLAAAIDDFVVFLFVLDLSFVIRGHLAQSIGPRTPPGADHPGD